MAQHVFRKGSSKASGSKFSPPEPVNVELDGLRNERQMLEGAEFIDLIPLHEDLCVEIRASKDKKEIIIGLYHPGGKDIFFEYNTATMDIPNWERYFFIRTKVKPNKGRQFYLETLIEALMLDQDCFEGRLRIDGKAFQIAKGERGLIRLFPVGVPDLSTEELQSNTPKTERDDSPKQMSFLAPK